MKINKEFKKAFTMSEALMTLVLIGAIAAMTITALISHHRQTVAKVKVRKAITEYDSFLRRAQADNFMTVKTNAQLYNLIHQDNCAKIVDYITILEKNGCKFTTPDGIWWELVTDDNSILWAVAATTENDLNTIVKDNNKATAYKNGAWFYAAFDNDGVLRVNSQQAAEEIAGNICNDGNVSVACRANNNLKNFIDK